MKKITTPLAILAFVLLLPVAATAQIMSLYQFDSNLNDTVRTSGAGAVLAGSNNYSYVSGIIGSALSINGSSSSGTLIRAPQAGAGLSAYTISAWVNFASATPWSTIVKNWGSTEEGAYHFGLFDSNQQLSNFIGTSSGVSAVVAPSTITTGVWTHAAVTFGGGFQTLFINGVSVATDAISGTVVNNFSWMSFGAKLSDDQAGVGGPAGWFDGMLDEVAFFNTNLTSTQILGIYDAGTNGQSVTTLGYTFEPYVDPGPVAIPEPGTWAAAALLVGGAAFMRWRKRTKVS
jgi:hypothetical protein